MRKFLISAAIVSLIGGASLAMAQDRDHRGPERGNSAESGRNSIGQPQTREHHDAPPSGVRDRAPDANAGRPDSGRRDDSIGQRDTRGDNDRRRDNDRPDFNRPGPDRRDVRGPDNRRNFDNGRGDRGRRDFSNYRNYHQNFRASQRFRAPPYRRPPGYFVRRWSWGQTLPVAFWTRDYWLTDFYAYGLPPPPYGAVWVRVGDDALLIDQYTGEIIEVDYGVFY
jgi:Ni/Co efflux regulator RcnB